MMFSDEWTIKEIGDLISSDFPICYGVLKPGDYHYDGIPLVRIVDITENYFCSAELFKISKTLDQEFRRSRLSGGELLISIQGTIGRVAIAPPEAHGTNISRTIARVSIDKDKANSHYIRQWLLSQVGQQTLRDAVSGTTRDSLNLCALRKLKLNLPIELSEQAKIAEILSTVDLAIEQTEGLIVKQQQVKAGLMQDLLTRGIDEHGNLRTEETHEFKDSKLGRIPVDWEVKAIDKKIGGLIDYRGKTPNKVEAGIPLLTAKNVRDGYLDEEPREYIAETAFDGWMTRGLPNPGDVLFTTEAPMGNVARVPNYQIALAQRLLTLQPKTGELSADYLYWLLHWKRSTERLESLTSGSTVVGVKQSVFRKMEYRFPKFNEQARISAILNSHKMACINEERKLVKLYALKTGLMQDLLTGKVRVTPLLEMTEFGV